MLHVMRYKCFVVFVVTQQVTLLYVIFHVLCYVTLHVLHVTCVVIYFFPASHVDKSSSDTE